MQDRVELVRGLLAEFASAKVLVPRSKRPLEFEATGSYDKAAWSRDRPTERPGGAHRRPGADHQGGDRIRPHRTRVERRFQRGKEVVPRVQIGGGMGGGTPVPISRDPNSNAPGGTSIAVLFHKPIEPVKAAEIKKMLAPVLDFDKRSATEIYAETLSPEMKQNIKEKRVTVGMDRDQVVMALGRPTHKSRETLDGLEVEDWVFGAPPGKITFVTFNGDKVIKVKESYAGLGTEVADQPVVR